MGCQKVIKINLIELHFDFWKTSGSLAASKLVGLYLLSRPTLFSHNQNLIINGSDVSKIAVSHGIPGGLAGGYLIGTLADSLFYC